MADPFDTLIENLCGNVPKSMTFMTKEDAYEALKQISGEDWGYDADAWRKRKSVIMDRLSLSTSAEEIRQREISLRKKMRKIRTEDM